MPTFKDMVKQLGGVPVANEDLFLAGGKWYFCDPTNGTAGGSGRTPATACSSLATTYGYCRDAKNDGVIFIGGATGNALTAALTWSKNYTHLIGVSSPLPGMGQRCRVTGSTTADLTVLVTFSGSGNVVKNIQFYNGTDADADSGAVVVSGSRNAFINCFFTAMMHATPAARAGCYSLSVSGAENYFYKCCVGSDTVIRTAASHELLVSGARNTFEGCTFDVYSETAGTFLVKIDNSGGDIRWTKFLDCDFQNYTVNLATGITNAFDMPADTAGHVVWLARCSAFGGGAAGIGMAWSDADTNIFNASPAGAATGGKSAAAN